MSERIVCFDLGGVVVRICRSWAEGCAAAGLEVRADGRSTEEAILKRRELLHDYDTGRIDCETFFREVSQVLNGVYSPEEIRRVHDAWILGEYDGIAELIEEINASGAAARTACLSNTNHRHWESMRGMRALEAIAHPHASHLLGQRKPDASIYAAFEEALGARGEEIVFFDDLEENVESGKARGWRAVLIDHEGDPAAQARAALREIGVL